MARHGASVTLDPAALDGVAASRAIVEALAADPEPHYGISTGFGALATTFIAEDRRAQLQASLVRSHAAGSGAEVEREVVRALMLLRLSTLMTGRTGVRRETAETYAAILNAGITPVVREYGSLGCSGDLAPLAHCALVAMGEGEVRDASGELTDAASALSAAGITPLRLGEKEGLALINGTDGMLGMLALAIDDLRMLLTTADIAAAMSVEGLMGTDAVFAEDLHALRPQRGQAASASNLRRLLAGSPIVASHKGPECTRVQDAYSLRCAPQVHGAARDTLAHAASVADAELASAIDNPVLTLDGRVESNGNFHGAPVGYVLDFLAIAVADVASMSERRTDRFLDPARNQGLPPFLAHEVGVDSGLMIAQYTAAGHRVGAEAARGAGLGRLDPVIGDAGGPRLDGLGRRAQAAARDRRAHACARDRGHDGGAWARAAGAARAGCGDGCGGVARRGGRRSAGAGPLPHARDRGDHRARGRRRGRRGGRSRRGATPLRLSARGFTQPVRMSRGAVRNPPNRCHG